MSEDKKPSPDHDLPPPGTTPDAPTLFDPKLAFEMGAKTPVPSSAQWSPPAPEVLDPLFPDYEITELLGRGGMGAVYKGVQKSLDRDVAIKLLPPELAELDPSFAARFEREAKSMAKLDHPNIVTVYNFGKTAAGHYYIVMEFVDGMDFHQLIHSHQLDTAGALHAVSQICDALEYAHSKGYVHRDIKPANIFINQAGRVKVGDFGLAKIVGGEDAASPDNESLITMTGTGMGTLVYAAPEQMDGRPVDRRADIYSLGVMLYEMLTGELPRGNFQPPSKRVQIDIRLDRVVLRAMESEPERRYSNVTEMRTEVEQVRTSPPRPRKDGGEPAGKKKTVPLGLKLIIGLLTLAGGLALVQFRPWEKQNPNGTVVAAPGNIPESSPPSRESQNAGPVDLPGLFGNTLGMKFIPVPESGVLMCLHETRMKDYAPFANEVAGINPRWKNSDIGGGPVTDNHPVCSVTWAEANAFCEWLSKKEGRKYRLPTDREWSRAAGTADLEPISMTPHKLGQLGSGGPFYEAANFADASWKTAFPERNPTEGGNDGFPASAPVMSFAPNLLGIYDLKGNVWEFCSDYLSERRDVRTIRGNSWNDPKSPWATRSGRKEDQHHDTTGFRCVLEGPDFPFPAPAVVTPVIEGAPRRFGLSRYQLVKGAMPWSEARAKASEMGGHLAVPSTHAELDWLIKSYGPFLASPGQNLWLGIHSDNTDSAAGRFSVTNEVWTASDWPWKTANSVPAKAPLLFSALSRNPSGEIEAAAVLPGPEHSAGFLVEWDDSAGNPPLPVAGARPEGSFTNSLGMKFLPVPGTEIFLCIHEARKSDFAKFAEEHPGLVDWRNVPTFQNLPVSTEDDHPVVNVNWYEARAFCEWLSRKEGRTYRLPTDYEWSVAAGIGELEAEGYTPTALNLGLDPAPIFAWGSNRDGARPEADNYFDQTAAKIVPGASGMAMNGYNDGFATTSPVMRYRANTLGFFDMAGNVREFCEDRIEPGTEGVAVRGGTFAEKAKSLTERSSFSPPSRHNNGGFRCALVAGPDPAAAPKKPPLAERITLVGSPLRNGLSRYQVAEGAVTWGEARVFAESLGGHLANPTTSDENEWVKASYGDRTASPGDCLWLGGFFHDGFCWQNGENYAYQDWLKETDFSGTTGGILETRKAQVLAKGEDGKLAWGIRTISGGTAQSPRGFLIEWDDASGEPPLEVPGSPPTAPFANSLGMKFVPVPGTKVYFCAHETRKRDYAAFAGTRADLPGDWRSPYFADLPVSAGDDHPAVMVNWHEARDFCDWLSRKEGRTYRLPTDREWSVAMGLGDLEDSAETPQALWERFSSRQTWGPRPRPPKGVGNLADESLRTALRRRQPCIEGYDDGFPTTAPVMSFPSNPLGIFDLDGNVSEWVEDRWNGSPALRCLRGSNWIEPKFLQSTWRIGKLSSDRRIFSGFRCVLVVELGRN